MDSDWPELAGLAAKMDREEAYHRMHAEMWRDKLARRTSASRPPSRELWPYALGVLEPAQRGRLAAAVGREEVEAVERGAHEDGFVALHERDDDGTPLDPGCRMVTAEQVWEALAEVPDPEIPVISLVDLGVVREVEVDGRPRPRRVHAHVPRLPGAGGHARAAGRGRPRARRRAGDRRRPRRLLVDRPDHARRAGASSRSRASPRPTRAPRPARRSSNSTRRRSAARTAARRRRAWRTSSARPRAARSATARAAGSRSSSSRRSRGPIQKAFRWQGRRPAERPTIRSARSCTISSPRTRARNAVAGIPRSYRPPTVLVFSDLPW